MQQLNDIYTQTLGYLLRPIGGFLRDPDVSEIMINGYDEIYIERRGKLEKTAVAFADDDRWRAAARNIAQYVGKRLDPAEMSIEARLPDGSRVHLIQAPAARRGLTATIRKFSKNQLNLRQLIESGSLTPETAEFLAIAVRLAKNIIVSGGTGSGKTTLLNSLSAMIEPGERIVVLEDSSELQLQQDHVVGFEVQPKDRHGRGGIDMRELFRGSLRMRPDRIIVGECRGGEALDMIQAMTSGHDGSMSTCHANTPKDALHRLETMAMMSGVDMPLQALRAQLTSAIDVIVQIGRQRDGSRKVTHISEVMPLGEDGQYRLQDIYRFVTPQRDGKNEIEGRLAWTEVVPSFRQELWDKTQGKWVRATEHIW